MQRVDIDRPKLQSHSSLVLDWVFPPFLSIDLYLAGCDLRLDSRCWCWFKGYAGFKEMDTDI
jgi:hypothetical protein